MGNQEHNYHQFAPSPQWQRSRPHYCHCKSVSSLNFSQFLCFLPYPLGRQSPVLRTQKTSLSPKQYGEWRIGCKPNMWLPSFATSDTLAFWGSRPPSARLFVGEEGWGLPAGSEGFATTSGVHRVRGPGKGSCQNCQELLSKPFEQAFCYLKSQTKSSAVRIWTNTQRLSDSLWFLQSRVQA